MLSYILPQLAGSCILHALTGNVFVSEAEDLRFKSRAVQIGYSVANGSLLLRHFESCTAWVQ